MLLRLGQYEPARQPRHDRCRADLRRRRGRGIADYARATDRGHPSAARSADRRDPEGAPGAGLRRPGRRSDEQTSELQSLMRISFAVFCLTTKLTITTP